MREEFEKLPEIAERLYAGIYWNDYQGKYQTDYPTLLATVGYLNGAWYAYQEQQKRIDLIFNELTENYQELSLESIKNIQELLK